MSKRPKAKCMCIGHGDCKATIEQPCNCSCHRDGSEGCAGCKCKTRSKTVLQLVREYFPNASLQEADAILWAKTGYPAFLADGENTLREQLATLKRAMELKRDVCYCCGKIRFKKQMRDEMCIRGLAELKALELSAQNQAAQDSPTLATKGEK